MTISNGRALKKLRMHFRDQLSDWQPVQGVKMRDQKPPTKDCERDHPIIFHRGTYNWGEDEDGHLHVTAKHGSEPAHTQDDRIGPGVLDDPDGSKLYKTLPPDVREKIDKMRTLRTLADINAANAELWKKKS